MEDNFDNIIKCIISACILVTLAQDCLMASLSSVWVTALVTITSRRGDLPGPEHTDRGESRGLLPAEGFKISDND